jgi:hypothetical protein
LLVNLATVGLVLLIGLRLVNWETGLAAATAYVVLAINPAVMGLAAHATHFVVLFTLAGLLLLLGDTSSSSLASIFISGLLLGVAVLMKQPGIIFLIFGFFWLLSRERKQPLPRLLSILAVLYLWCTTITNYCNRRGLVRRFLGELLVLVRPIRASVRNQHLDQRGMGFVSKQYPSGIWRMLAHLAIERSRAGYCFGKARQIQAAVSGRFDNRVCSRGINGIVFSAALLRHASTGIVIVCWRCSCLRCGNAAPDYAGNRPFGLCHFRGVSDCDARRILLSDVPVDACRFRYGENPFPEAIKVAEFLRENSRPDERLVVLGSEPEIYFYSRRQSATGFIYMYPLMEQQPFASQMQRQMIEEVEKNRPGFVVWVWTPMSWRVAASSERLLFQWADQYLGDNYRPVGLVNMPPQGRTDYYLPIETADLQLAENFIIIYQRR